MRKLFAGLACVGSLCVSAPGLAAARADDVAATRAYLGAYGGYERGAYAEIGVRVAATEARASEIGGECTSVLTYAPRDVAFGELGEEAEATAFFAGVVPERSMLLRFAHTIEHLRWSDRRLTRLVRAEAAEERAIVTLALPDVCADIAAWKAGAYAALPQNAARFLAHVQAIESLSGAGPSEESREGAIMRLLRPYERLVERRTAKRIERLEAQIGRRLKAEGVSAEKKLAAGLGVAVL
jgi:hypothetical protein